MKYAKIRERLPLCRRVDEIDPEDDELREDVYQDDQLIVKREDELSEELLEELDRRGVRKIWVESPTYRWMPYDEALDQKKNIVETKIADPLQDHLISELDDIRSLEAIQRILKEYEESEVDDMLFSEIVSMRSYVPDLMERQETLSERIDSVEDEDTKLQLIDILRARNPNFDPEGVPAEYRSLVSDLADFIQDVTKFQSELKELIVEVDSEKTPELSREELRADEDVEEDPLIEAENLIDELFPAPPEDVPDFLKQGLFQDSFELIQSLTKRSHWDEGQARAVIKRLQGLSEELPEIFWAVPLNSVNQSNLFLQSIVRLIVHAQVWPEDLLGDDNFQESNRWCFAHFACDLGMLEIPETFWLHEQEFEDYQRMEIRKHPEQSVKFVRDIENVPEGVEEWILRHHQRGKNKGYPKDLLSDPWPPASQKLALCDVYEALTSPRYWREKKSPKESMRFLEQTFCDARGEFLTQFQSAIGVHPPGSLVRLRDDRIALIESVRTVDGCEVIPLRKESDTFSGIGSPVHLENPTEEFQSYPRTRVAPWSIRRLRWKHDESLNPESL